MQADYADIVRNVAPFIGGAIAVAAVLVGVGKFLNGYKMLRQKAQNFEAQIDALTHSVTQIGERVNAIYTLVPRLSELPTAEQIDRLSKLPTAEQIDHLTELLTAEQIGRLSKLPTAEQIDRLTELLTAEQIGRLSKLPTAEQIEHLSNLPTAEQIDRLSNLPTGEQIDRLSRAMERQLGEEEAPSKDEGETGERSTSA